MRSLIVGSQGLVGSALSKQLPNALQGVLLEPENPNQKFVDLTRYETLFKVFADFRPDIVYLAGAITDVDKCEDFGTKVVNVKGSTFVLRLCEQFESKLVFYSSSYVFDGNSETPYSPDDETFPIQSYGKQKVIMEDLISQSDAEWLIIRTVGVFGNERRKKNFAKQVISSVFSGKDVYAPSDQFMNPINSTDLAKISIRLAEGGEQGIWHVAGDTCLSKYDFARMIASVFGYENKVHPVTSEEMKQRVLRPKMGCLDCSALESVPSLSTGLQRFLASIEYNG